ncbi:hypothetical protein FB45DRAFT_965 [Roridomyces roridus]|uniref:Uncharacterized protein n=1 Tax=Roridomyces roridus TaxID=1738132 RepID=A0AAD7FXZ2_9AGAR|nr:hypothetical protein FB45DRAFT_965 [Roridomyces roridus]
MNVVRQTKSLHLPMDIGHSQSTPLGRAGRPCPVCALVGYQTTCILHKPLHVSIRPNITLRCSRSSSHAHATLETKILLQLCCMTKHTPQRPLKTSRAGHILKSRRRRCSVSHDQEADFAQNSVVLRHASTNSVSSAVRSRRRRPTATRHQCLCCRTKLTPQRPPKTARAGKVLRSRRRRYSPSHDQESDFCTKVSRSSPCLNQFISFGSPVRFAFLRRCF